jgi:hypothetical protein
LLAFFDDGVLVSGVTDRTKPSETERSEAGSGAPVLELVGALATLRSAMTAASQADPVAALEMHRWRDALEKVAATVGSLDGDAAMSSQKWRDTLHEARSTTSVVRSYVALLSRTPPAVGRSGPHTERVFEAAVRLEAVLDRLLTLSCCDEGHLRVDWQPTDVRAIAASVLDASAGAASDGGVRFYWRCTDGLPSAVWLDPLLLRRVFAGFRECASCVVPAGEVTLEWHADAETLLVRVAYPPRGSFGATEGGGACASDDSASWRDRWDSLEGRVAVRLVEALGGRVRFGPNARSVEAVLPAKIVASRSRTTERPEEGYKGFPMHYGRE